MAGELLWLGRARGKAPSFLMGVPAASALAYDLAVVRADRYRRLQRVKGIAANADPKAFGLDVVINLLEAIYEEL